MGGGTGDSTAIAPEVENGFVHILTTAVTTEKIRLFAEATGDYNPIHFDIEAAQKIGFDGPIAHGGLVLGIVSNAIFELFDAGVMPLKVSEIKFVKPVYIGDVITVSARTKRERERLKFVDVEVRSGQVLHLSICNMCILIPESDTY